MEVAKGNELRQGNTIAEALKKLAKEASRERKAIGYPEHFGKICYSQSVRQLAKEAFLQGFSASIIASTAGVTIKTAQKWLKGTQQASFRELRIVPTYEQSSVEKDIAVHARQKAAVRQPVEFVFHSGVRVFVGCDDLDEALLGIFLSAKGV